MRSMQNIPERKRAEREQLEINLPIWHMNFLIRIKKINKSESEKNGNAYATYERTFHLTHM